MKVTTRNRHFNKSLAALLITVSVIAISLAHYHTQFRQPRLQAFSLHEERDVSGYSAAERLMREGILSGACDEWEPPMGNETRVEKGCWKDRWYEQLSGVLNNWEEEYSKLSFAGNLNKENHAALQKLLHCLPHYSLPISPDAPQECHHQNALTVVLSAHWWTDMARGNGEPSGEVVHLRPIMQALDREHYTILTIYHKDYAGLVKIAAALPDVITTIWAEDRLVVSCMADPRCRSDFPQEEKARMGVSHVQGPIPAWKMVTPTYWALKPTSDWEWGQREGDGFTFNTLSHDWILSPFAYPGHHYIPFSLEDSCSSIPLIQNSERKDQAVILGKLTKYYYPDSMWGIAPPPEVWLNFRERTGIIPIGNAKSDNPTDTVPLGVINQGPVPFQNYTSEVGHSKMMIALGFPVISPSPYLALCQGVPVILPYSGDTPTPSGWDLYNGLLTQHGPAALIGEPHVYSYNLNDMDSFYAAVEKAKNNPIEPYFPEEMRLTNINRLTLQFVNRDARALAHEIEEARRQRGEPPHALVPDYVLRTIYKNGWGSRMRANGTVATVYGEE